MKNFRISLAVALLLGGCTTAQEAAISGAIKARMDFNDNKARISLRAPCDMAVGSYYRVVTPPEQKAVAVLCGGAEQRPVTADDVKRLLELRDALAPRDRE